jgi:gas vesicle protein GvpL/GvpF
VIHLYAFACGLRRVQPGLEVRPFGNLRAVFGRGEPDPLEHGLVVERLLDYADAVLPVRFGARFATEDELAAAISPRIEVLEHRLAHVAGCVEVGVRIVPRREPVAAPDGAAYMRARLSEEQAMEEVHRALAVRARDSVRTDGDAGYLVSRAEVEAFASVVERLLESHPELDALCTGPWAPYSFAEAA